MVQLQSYWLAILHLRFVLLHLQVDYSGKIKHKDVNKRVRWAMSEAANTVIRFDTRMKAIYETARRRHAGLHGPAIIVVANKMINIAWYLLRSRTPYESRNENLYKRKLARLERKRKK